MMAKVTECGFCGASDFHGFESDYAAICEKCVLHLAAQIMIDKYPHLNTEGKHGKAKDIKSIKH